MTRVCLDAFMRIYTQESSIPEHDNKSKHKSTRNVGDIELFHTAIILVLLLLDDNYNVHNMIYEFTYVY